MEVLPTHNFQPDIVIWGLRLGEPTIALTGLLVALICFYAWIRLGKLAVKDDPLKLSRIFFLITGISTIIGAVIGHLFLYAVPFEFKLPGWMLGMIAVSALQQASITRAKPYFGGTMAKAMSYFNIGVLTITLWFVSSTLWFPIVEIQSAIGFLLVILPLEILLWNKTRSRGSLEIMYGILILVGAVLAHILKISFGIWFSFFDIAHLFMCGAMWKFMHGSEAFATTAGSGDLSQIPSA